MRQNSGQLYIISAPSGAGKTSLLDALRAQMPDTALSVSHTTRHPRHGEQDGKHYHFTNVDSFLQQVEADEFLEYAQVFDNYYGTSRQTVEALLQADKDVILEIDWQGARQVRQRTENVVSIFILPPSLEALEERLRKRQQDSEETILRRMHDARNEMSHYPEYDYLVINDHFDTALAELSGIFRSERLRQERQAKHLRELLRQLVG